MSSQQIVTDAPPTTSAPSPHPSQALPEWRRTEAEPGSSDLAHQLRFEQFRQIATLSVAAAGGVLVLLQAGFIASSIKTGAAVAVFALAAAVSLFGQNTLVDNLEAGRGWTRGAWVYLMLAFLLMGAGSGLLIGVML